MQRNHKSDKELAVRIHTELSKRKQSDFLKNRQRLAQTVPPGRGRHGQGAHKKYAPSISHLWNAIKLNCDSVTHLLKQLPNEVLRAGWVKICQLAASFVANGTIKQYNQLGK